MGKKKMSASELQKMFSNKKTATSQKENSTPAVNTTKKKGKVFNKTGM